MRWHTSKFVHKPSTQVLNVALIRELPQNTSVRFLRRRILEFGSPPIADVPHPSPRNILLLLRIFFSLPVVQNLP
jgi:hypothetical protein